MSMRDIRTTTTTITIRIRMVIPIRIHIRMDIHTGIHRSGWEARLCLGTEAIITMIFMGTFTTELIAGFIPCPRRRSMVVGFTL